MCQGWNCVQNLEEPMKITISTIKADIGSLGGHIVPSRRLVEEDRVRVRAEAVQRAARLQ
jgi:fructose 1,6-bisphosphatase